MSKREREQRPIDTERPLNRREEFVAFCRLLIEIMVAEEGKDRSTVTFRDAMETILKWSKKKRQADPDECVRAFVRKIAKHFQAMCTLVKPRTSSIALLFAFDVGFESNRFSECISNLPSLSTKYPGPIERVILDFTQEWTKYDYLLGKVQIERITGNVYLPVVQACIANLRVREQVLGLIYSEPAVDRVESLALAVSFDHAEIKPAKRRKIEKEEDEEEDEEDIQVYEIIDK